MATVTFKGTPIALAGELPEVGAPAPAMRLLTTGLAEITTDDLRGKTTVLLTVPSLDTGVCAIEARTFNQRAAEVDGVQVICASSDLPFAIKRFCGAEGIENVAGASDLRDRDFGKRWGVTMTEGPLQGLTARAAFVIGPDGNVKHVELVPEITQEPDYDAILTAAQA